MSTRCVLGSQMGCCVFIITAASQIPFKVLVTNTGSLLFKILFCCCWLSSGFQWCWLSAYFAWLCGFTSWLVSSNWYLDRRLLVGLRSWVWSFDLKSTVTTKVREADCPVGFVWYIHREVQGYSSLSVSFTIKDLHIPIIIVCSTRQFAWWCQGG